jgi:hypothetical protein
MNSNFSRMNDASRLKRSSTDDMNMTTRGIMI